ncbi:hypothetical protein HOE31_01395, partial [bacterium]|nr:hypothetical protein [bacterium]
MTTKQFAILMGIITLICFGAFIMVLFFINPETTGGLGYLLFYFSLFFGIAGIMSLLGFLSRSLFTRKFEVFEQAQISFRQGIFFGIILAGSMFMQANRLLTWVNAILLVILLTVI